VYDVTGAGDTALAVLLCAWPREQRAARRRNSRTHAGIVVGKRGTACVTVEEILERIVEPWKDFVCAGTCGSRLSKEHAET